MAQTTNGIVLTSGVGSQTIYGANRDIPAKDDYTQARVDGSDSFYIVYNNVDYLEDPQISHTSHVSVIVDSQSNIGLGFVARSTQGWDKVGISLFAHPYYCGTGATFLSSNADVTEELPASNPYGASSLIVKKGIWALFTEKNYKGTQIAIQGKQEFGPGTNLAYLGDQQGDKIKSVKYLREK